MILASGTDYGALDSVVRAASALATTATAIGALWWARPSLSDVPEGLVKAGEVVLTSIGIVLIWSQFSELSSGPALIRLTEILTGGLILSLLGLLLVLTAGKTFLLYRGTEDEVRVLGGLWLTSLGKQEKDKWGGVQATYEAFIYNAPDLWPIASRTLKLILLVIFDWSTAVCGSLALTAAGMLLLMHEVPIIYEFSVSPVTVEPNTTTTIHWRVSENTIRVELAPFGDVAKQGDRTVTPTVNTDYKLTAFNSIGNRSIEQSVTVYGIAPVPHRGARTNYTPPTVARLTDIDVEARNCVLDKNVVIRGTGWLESENENDPDAVSQAECSVQVQKEGKYEIFVTYAADESRPIQVTLNQLVIDEKALAAPTGGWSEPNQEERSLGVWTLNPGKNIVKFYREHPIPHIQRIRFRPSS